MKVWCWLGAIVLAVVVALGVSGVIHGPLDPDHPHQDLCAQGNALRTARLLDKAAETYAKASEKCPQLQDVELTEREADELFAAGNLYALAAPAEPASPPAAPPTGEKKPDESKPDEQEPNSAKANSRKAIDNFASGLALDPFDEQANLALDLELKKELIDLQVRCETAANLVDAGLLTLAGAALAPGLVQENELCETTVSGLETKRKKAATYLFEAKNLGDEDAARTAYAKALRENANLKAAQTGLEDSLNDESCLDEIGSWFAGIPGTLETALKWFIPLVIVLLVLALLAWMAIRESAARWSWSRRLFQKWGEHPGFSFLYKAAVPDIEIKPFEGKGGSDLAGADFSTLLGAEISRPAGREPAFPFDRVTTGIEPDAKDNVTVVDLLTEIPATKLLGNAFSALSKLFRRRTILLTGHLAPTADKGAGVFLSVEGNDKKLNESTTLWERTYDPKPGSETGAVCWMRLIPPSSVWARWHLAEAQDPTKELKTERWKADALFQSAQAWQLEGDGDRAEGLYTEALENEPGLLPASHNLSVIELRKRRYKQARERVETLRAILKNGDKDELTAKEMAELWPTLDTASLYTLMLALAYPKIDSKANAKDGDLGEAVNTGQLLVEKLTTQLKAATKEEKSETQAEKEKRLLLKEQLELAEPAAVVVLASLAIREATDGEKATAVEYAIARGAGVKKVTRKQLRKEVRDLKPWDLIHGYAETKPHVSRRAHYNLACYYTTLSELVSGEQQAKCRERAIESLEAALVGARLVTWADKDPSLAPLKQAWPEKFKKVLEERTIEDHPKDQKPKEGTEEGKKSPADEERKSILALLIELRDAIGRSANQ